MQQKTSLKFLSHLNYLKNFSLVIKCDLDQFVSFTLWKFSVASIDREKFKLFECSAILIVFLGEAMWLLVQSFSPIS